MSSLKEHITLTPAISLIFSSTDSKVGFIFFLWIFSIILSIDFTLDLIASIGFLSYSSENCSFNTLNFVSTSITAHLYLDIIASILCLLLKMAVAICCLSISKSLFKDMLFNFVSIKYFPHSQRFLLFHPLYNEYTIFCHT